MQESHEGAKQLDCYIKYFTQSYEYFSNWRFKIHRHLWSKFFENLFGILEDVKGDFYIRSVTEAIVQNIKEYD